MAQIQPFVVVNKKDQAQPPPSFFDHINSCDDNIKFNQEEAQENTLAFLGTAIHHTHRSLSTVQLTLPPYLGAIQSLEYRAYCVISNQSDINEEVSYVSDALRKCNYLKWAFRKAAESDQGKSSTTAHSRLSGNQRALARVTISCIQGLRERERVKKAPKPLDTTTTFKPAYSLRDNLVQDRTPKKSVPMSYTP